MRARRRAPTRRRPTKPGVAIATLVLVVAGVVLATVWQIVDSRRSLREQVLESNLSAARIASGLVAAQVDGELRTVEAVARRPSLVQSATAGRWDEAVFHLEDLTEISSDTLTAALLDRDGRLRARVPFDESVVGADLSSRDYFQGAISRDDVYASELFTQNGSPRAEVVAFAAPVRDPASGAVVAVLQATVAADRLAVIARSVPVPRGGSIQIFDHRGHALTGRARDPSRSFATRPGLAQALAGTAGVGEMELPGLEGQRLVAYAPTPATGWATIVEQPRSAAYADVADFTAREVAIGVLVALGALVGALVTVRLLRQLARERNRATSILASVADGVATTDPDGRLLSVNPALEELAGWSEDEVRGRPITDVYRFLTADARAVPTDRNLLMQALEERQPVATRGYDVVLAVRDGRRVPVSVTAAPVLDDRGDLEGGVLLVRDVTHEREVDQLKSTLVSTASHELRTPLTMIQGFSELLLDRDLGEEHTREALEQINTSAERLARLVDDLLSVSRIESGRLVVRAIPVQLATLCEQAVGTFAREGRDFVVDVDPALPPVLADPDHLLQVLTNLVSNAIKYSPRSTRVRVSALCEGHTAIVSVEDEGIGLAPEEASEVFDKFTRIERPEVRQVSGTGLGLYITKHLVELQGGQVWVRSEPGRGSTFSFSLPLAGSEGRDDEERSIDADAAHRR